MPLDERVVLDCATVIYALGTRANPSSGTRLGPRAHQVGLHRRLRSAQATNLPGVFAGGDIVTGGATVRSSPWEPSRRAAKAIAAYLADGERRWPVSPETIETFVPPAPLPAAAIATAAETA